MIHPCTLVKKAVKKGSERSSPIKGRLTGRPLGLPRGGQSCGRTMNHSTYSVHRFSSSKRNVHRFQ
jgi:hypothetical protein